MPGRPTKDPYTRPAISTLERLHAELGGQNILEIRQKYQELSEQMRHVEVCIKLLDPGYSQAGIAVKRRKPNKLFKRGTLYRLRAGRAQDDDGADDSNRDRRWIGRSWCGERQQRERPERGARHTAHSLKNHEGKGVEGSARLVRPDDAC